jgi:hypothetical protein
MLFTEARTGPRGEVDIPFGARADPLTKRPPESIC